MDGGKFVGEWLMAVEVYVLVRVRWLPVDVKVEGSVGIPDDCDVKHGDSSVFLYFFRPLYVRLDGVEIVV